ncbi:glutamate receptor ionotropic, delta-2-like [Centruroides vittatus]|uniref:glutamate receptor ionotropic, delta-2-like n=1 Tax=Centruroides vittatus TaxID=120091 RepID=UPI00350EBEF0
MDVDAGETIFKKHLHCLAFADVVILGRSKEVIEEAFKIMDEIAIDKGLTVNDKKAKYINLIRKDCQGPSGQILYIKDHKLEQVNKFQYLGTHMTEKNEIDEEIKARVTAANGSYYTLRRILTSKEISRYKEERESYIWKIAGLKNPKYMRMDEFENQITNGQYFHVFNAVHQKLGFRYILAKPVDDTWNEMGVKLQKKEADMAYISLFMTYDRFSVMDFSSPLMCPSVSFIVKAPEKFPNWSSIIKPFTIQIWIVLFFTSLGFGLILHKVIEHDFIADEIKIYWPRRKIFWNLFCTFVYEGIQLNDIRRFPSRLLIGIWLLSVFVLISSYSGTLMSFMTYPTIEPVPKDFDELAKAVQRGEYSCGIAPATAIWNTIKVSKSGNAKILRDHIIENNNLVKSAEAVKLVLQKRFAFIAVLKFLKLFFIKEKEMYKYTISDDTLFTFVEAYPMRKKFPMKENVSMVNILTFIRRKAQLSSSLSSRDITLVERGGLLVSLRGMTRRKKEMKEEGEVRLGDINGSA